MAKSFVFSSESVGEGHPDKVADLISDSVLDACLRIDSRSRVACETMVKSNMVIVAGEITIPKLGSKPMTNLYLALLDRMGVQAERIGDSTGKLESI